MECSWRYTIILIFLGGGGWGGGEWGEGGGGGERDWTKDPDIKCYEEYT